jgi:arginine/lysine/ornithine decarboxylase
VLKAQLKFRKEVLHQVAEDKATYNITKTVRDKKSRQNLSVDELKENFKQLVDDKETFDCMKLYVVCTCKMIPP